MFEMIFKENEQQFIIKFQKHLDTNVSSELALVIKDKLDSILGKDKKSETLKIMFDLKDTDYISSTFLRIVLMCAKRVNNSNFLVINACQSIRDLFEISGLNKFIEISKTTEKISKYEPPISFSKNSWVKSFDEYKKLYNESIINPESFWDTMAKNHIIWEKPYDKVMEWIPPYSKWFIGGKLNASYNCLDKHLSTSGDKTALIWEGEPEDPTQSAEIRNITYLQLYKMVCKIANVLKNNGISKGDRVVIYMPMIPETIASMLACARIGAIHSVIFAGFSAQSIADRVDDCKAKLILTVDGTYRKGSILNLKKVVDEAMSLKGDDGATKIETVKKVIIHKHVDNAITFNKAVDLWLHEEMEKADEHCEPEWMDSEDTLFILYTSGSTGKPKGVLHTTGGYILGTKLTHKYLFDIKDEDIYWCTADVGWITGHSYITYGPLSNCSTVFMYEGAPNFPDASRFWKIIDKHKITILYTSPTAIRSFMQWGDYWPAQYSLASLRLLGSVGEPINPQAWLWYHKNIGHERCPIVDTWWQTETGAIMISPFPGAFAAKPGSATLPFFGIEPDVVNSKGESLEPNKNGTLVIKKPWPSMLRGLWNDSERYENTYWAEYQGRYATGDSARKDEDGYIWIIGREDDVINVSGHRIGTAEVESALVSHHSVAEAAAVSRADDLKGSALVVFVTLKQHVKGSKELAEELRSHVGKELGAIVKPDEVRFAEALPKTRSGKIMRRLLKQVAAGTEITGDTTTLEDINVVAKLAEEQE